MKLSEHCELYFGSRDLYEVFNITKQASETEVRKAYHKLSLSCHPDRVEEDKKTEATEKFKVLGRIHSILSDPEKRAIYDETGMWLDEDDDAAFRERDWMGYWRSLFKKITISDIQKYEDGYKGSQEELKDIKAAYEKCKGDMDKMFEIILFATLDDEDRIRGLIKDLIDKKEVPAYNSFINESQAKRDRRMRKLKKEAREAEKQAKETAEKEGNSLSDLQSAILARRQGNSESFLSALEKKYACPKKSEKTKKKSSRGKSKK